MVRVRVTSRVLVRVRVKVMVGNRVRGLVFTVS